MFDRVAYKQIAKKQLSGRWTTPILATIVVQALFILLSLPSVFLAKNMENVQGIIQQDSNVSGVIIEKGISFGLPGISLFGFKADDGLAIITLGIIGVILIAYTSLFLSLAKSREEQPFSAFLAGFNLWLKGMLGMFWSFIWIFLWSLLFIIPGFVKAYAYSQIFFILAENPKIGVCKAMRLSKEITRGYKGDLFILDLSFIGWALLTSLTGGLLGMYTMPYMQMTKTNAYLVLKAMAIKSGRLSEYDFNGRSAEHIAESSDEHSDSESGENDTNEE